MRDPLREKRDLHIGATGVFVMDPQRLNVLDFCHIGFCGVASMPAEKRMASGSCREVVERVEPGRTAWARKRGPAGIASA